MQVLMITYIKYIVKSGVSDSSVFSTYLTYNKTKY
ncbi:MAG: hypothetical protein K0S32_77 [Bacteroidetes bacterium]|jgi:hypothetical protein|nr:hypothetical protein [Bacteroidota bacterium]